MIDGHYGREEMATSNETLNYSTDTIYRKVGGSHYLISENFLIVNVIIFICLIGLCFLGNWMYRSNTIDTLKSEVTQLNYDLNDHKRTREELRKIKLYYGKVIGLAETVTLGKRDMEIFLDQKADRQSWQNLLTKVTNGIDISAWFTSASQDVEAEDVQEFDHLKVVINLTGGNKPK